MNIDEFDWRTANNTFPIEEVISGYLGKNINSRGRCACPVHGGTHPNMSIQRDENKATCFSVCGGKSYNPIGLISAVEDIRPSEAFYELCEYFGIEPTRFPGINERGIKKIEEEVKPSEFENITKEEYEALDIRVKLTRPIVINRKVIRLTDKQISYILYCSLYRKIKVLNHINERLMNKYYINEDFDFTEEKFRDKYKKATDISQILYKKYYELEKKCVRIGLDKPPLGYKAVYYTNKELRKRSPSISVYLNQRGEATDLPEYTIPEYFKGIIEGVNHIDLYENEMQKKYVKLFHIPDYQGTGFTMEEKKYCKLVEKILDKRFNDTSDLIDALEYEKKYLGEISEEGEKLYKEILISLNTENGYNLDLRKRLEKIKEENGIQEEIIPEFLEEENKEL